MNQEPDIQHKATLTGDSSFAYEDGSRVLFVGSGIGENLDQSNPESDARAEQSVLLKGLLKIICGKPNHVDPARRAMILGYYNGVVDARNLGELAAMLKVTQARLSQILKDFRAEYKGLVPHVKLKKSTSRK